jgi:hypothetical protein
LRVFTAAIKQLPNIAYGRANELTPLGREWEKIINEDTKKLTLEDRHDKGLLMDLA